MSLWVEYLHDECTDGKNHRYIFWVCRDHETSSDDMRGTLQGMFKWCEEFVGPLYSGWAYDIDYLMFTFGSESDAFAFRLRWC